jgi:hypothetical protein
MNSAFGTAFKSVNEMTETFMKTYPKGYLEIASTRRTGAYGWVCSENRDNNPERLVINSEQKPSLLAAAQWLMGAKDPDFTRSLKPLLDWYDNYLDDNAYAYFILTFNGQVGWNITISSIADEKHPQYKVCVNVDCVDLGVACSLAVNILNDTDIASKI